MMSMTNIVAIDVETLRIDGGCFLEKEFTVNQVDYVYSPLTRDTKDILWIDDRVLIMTYKSLATGYLKHHILDTT